MSNAAKNSLVGGRQRLGDEKSYKDLSKLIHTCSGISLNDGKSTLIETRLSRRISDLNLLRLSDYVSVLKKSPEELQVCVELLTTHKTEWFRENVHFDWLKTRTPEFKKRAEPIQIWSAACSSGHEVYSLMFFLLREGFSSSRFRILGTDISRAILEKAADLPSTAEFEKVARSFSTHFNSPDHLESEVNHSIMSSIKFREFNLIESSLPTRVQFDVIFLRNVLIYFDRPTVKRVCKMLSRHLKPHGHLVLGLSETLHGDVPELEAIGNSIYQYNPGKKL